MKLQSSCWSLEQSAAFFESRFNGRDDFINGEFSPVLPFRLSHRASYIANWNSIERNLPAGWDDDEFQIVGKPYHWCETLADDCDCHGAKGGLSFIYCSDFGLHEETNKRTRKSPNVWYPNYIQQMEQRLAELDKSRKEQLIDNEIGTLGNNTVSDTGQSIVQFPSLSKGFKTIEQMVDHFSAQQFYCLIHECNHSFNLSVKLKTHAVIHELCAKVSAEPVSTQQTVTPQIENLAVHLFGDYQLEDCAQQQVSGAVEVPDVLYKYIPIDRIGKGAPNTLRATQLQALNDEMECNVVARKDSKHEDTLTFLRTVQSELEQNLGMEVSWEELLRRTNRHGDPRVSTFIQQYLNSRVGVVSFSTDVCVPTMWAHYARNTGIVVGYDTATLRTLGFDLRPVIYSEIAPGWTPKRDNTIQLNFVDRERIQREKQTGKSRNGLPILTSASITELGTDWKSLSRLLFVKGLSWAYEKEVRLLVDLKQTKDTNKCDKGHCPIKVIEPDPNAIKKIYRGVNTKDVDVRRAIEVARGENLKGLFVGTLSAHAFRIQKTGGVNY